MDIESTIFQNWLSVITVIISLIALLISLLSHWSNNPPLTIKRPIMLFITSDLTSPPLESGQIVLESIPYVKWSLRVINPRSANVSLFNIQVIDENCVPYNFLRQLYFNSPDSFFYMKGNNEPYYTKINLPYSHYHTFDTSSFSHLDIVVELEPIIEKRPKEITIFFRDTRSTLFGRRFKYEQGFERMRHPFHSFKFSLNDEYYEHLQREYDNWVEAHQPAFED